MTDKRVLSFFYILLTVHHVMILGKRQTWCTNSFLCVFSIYNSLHVSNTRCSSSGETNFINTACVTVILCWWPRCVQVGRRR